MILLDQQMQQTQDFTKRVVINISKLWIWGGPRNSDFLELITETRATDDHWSRSLIFALKKRKQATMKEREKEGKRHPVSKFQFWLMIKEKRLSLETQKMGQCRWLSLSEHYLGEASEVQQSGKRFFFFAWLGLCMLSCKTIIIIIAEFFNFQFSEYRQRHTCKVKLWQIPLGSGFSIAAMISAIWKLLPLFQVIDWLFFLIFYISFLTNILVIN